MSTELTSQTLSDARVMQSPDGGGGGTGGLPFLRITMGAVPPVHGAQPGTGITVSGTWEQFDYEGPFTISVSAGGVTFPASVGRQTIGGQTWSALVRFYKSGTIPVVAEIVDSSTQTSRTSLPQTVAVTIDSPTVDLAIIEPAAGVAVGVGEGGTGVAVQATTASGFGNRQVTWTMAGPSGWSSSGGTLPLVAEGGLFAGTVPLPSTPLGRFTITMRATAIGPSGTEVDPMLAQTASVSIEAVDAGEPHLDVRLPKPDQSYRAIPTSGETPAFDVPVALTATDSQSHIKDVTCSVDGAAPVTLLTADGPYSGTIRVSGLGEHVLTFTAVDAATRAVGDTRGTNVVNIPITLLSDYHPATLDERLDDRAYLSALLDFSCTQVSIEADAAPLRPATIADLEKATFLRLGDLTQPWGDLSGVGNMPVSRLQLAVETLRDFLSLNPDLVAARWDFVPAAAATTTIPDLSGHGLNLTLAGSANIGDGPDSRRALVLDPLSGAAAPAGVGPRIGDHGGDYTVAFWIKVTADGTGAWRAVMHRGAVDAERTFAIWLRPNDNGLHVRVSTTSNGNEGIDATSPLTLGKWTHIVVTKAGNRLNVYLDGRFDITAELSAPSVGNAGPLRIGKDPFYGGFAGSISALEVLTEALPDALVPSLAGVAWPAADSIAQGLRSYGDAAYEALLKAFGTSSMELRLALATDSEHRDGVATRLGISLATAPTALDDLNLASGTRNEGILEQLFGLPSTDPALDPPRLVPPSALSIWRESALAQRWSEEDNALDPAVAGFPLIIDPDVITPSDLTPAGTTGLAAGLLAARTAEIAAIAADLDAVRTAESAQPAAFAALVGHALPGVDLDDLASRRAQGQNIGPALDAANLTETAYATLRAVAALANLGTVQADDWADTEALLTRVVTLSRHAHWRTEETGVSLTPALFTDSGPEPPPLRWRTDLASRRAWLRRLRSRAAELSSCRAELGEAVSSAQAAALPLLRDTFLSSIEGPTAAGDVARWLDVRLGTDILVGPGSPATTRLRAASEVVAGLLDALRGARIPAWHPVRSWQIDDENRFDDGWRWLSDMDGWVSAMLTWLYPENLLAPELAPLATPSFTALAGDMRAQQPGVDEARSRANQFLAPLRGSVEAGLRSPRARWALDENGGNKAQDTSGGGQDLDIIDAVPAEGLFGPALAFDGGTAVVNVPDPVFAALKPVANDFTLSFWAFPTAPHENDPQATSGTSGTSGQRFALGPTEAGSRFTDPNAAGAGVSVGTNGVSVYEHGDGYMPAILVFAAPITGWTHVAVVYEGRKPRLYLNGALVASAANPSPKATVYAVPDQLGNTRSGDLGGGRRVSYGAYQGLLSDVRIFPFALTAIEIGQVSFRLTEQRSSSEVKQLQGLAAALFAPYIAPRTQPSATALREVFWSAPVVIAQTLAQSGHYAAALDWFQTVWSLDLPPGTRAVYPVLAAETNKAVDLAPVGDWTSELNPHTVAGSRPNPYTRFTLAAIAQCLTDYGDSEFAHGLDPSIATARALYETAADVLASREMDFLGSPPGTSEVAFPNPPLAAQQSAVAVRLAMLRQGRDLAGNPRVSTAPDSATTLAAGPGAEPSSSVSLRPTPYRYQVLQDRARQLATVAQQIEQEYLSALEKYDAAEFRRFDAQKGVDVAEQNTKLQDLRITEADDGIQAATDQKSRADFLSDAYATRIAAGLNGYEQNVLNTYTEIRDLKDVVAGIDAAIGVAQAAQSANSLFDIIFSAGSKVGVAVGLSAAQIAKGITTGFLNDAESRLSANSFLASHERQVDDWKLQEALAEKDSLAAMHAQKTATDHRSVVVQEKAIADLQLTQAKATVTFLDRQFSNAELYAWMSGVLGGIYRYFLQLATATAALAQQQLAFERQDVAPSIINSDYWQPLPAPNAGTTTATPDRRGLTGAERLLQDITRLDQYAFETDKRRLNLTQSFSLADRIPLDFANFRETGRLSFATPMVWFDESFPGHLLRLVRRIRVSIVGLIPPTSGVRATLTSSGISRVVLPSAGFPTTTLVRTPESVALTSPVSATGVFDLDAQQALLLPFEGSGVDTRWTLDLPRPANPFDFRSLADVVITVDYTAADDQNYREQVLRRFADAGQTRGDRVFSLRSEFPDQFYELANPTDATAARSVSLAVDASAFPLAVGNLQVEQTVVSLQSNRGTSLPTVTLGLEHGGHGGTAQTIDGIVSTRRGNGAAWAGITGSPLGDWTLTLDPSAGALLDDGTLGDVLFVIGWSGDGPAWPS